MKKYKIKDDHSTAKKLAKLCEMASELGISIEYTRYGVCVITDKEFPGRRYLMEDIEEGPIMEFPPVMEYKITFEE